MNASWLEKYPKAAVMLQREDDILIEYNAQHGEHDEGEDNASAPPEPAEDEAVL